MRNLLGFTTTNKLENPVGWFGYRGDNVHWLPSHPVFSLMWFLKATGARLGVCTTGGTTSSMIM